MKNAVIDFRYEKGHLELNKILIEILSSFGTLDIYDNASAYYLNSTRGITCTNPLSILRAGRRSSSGQQNGLIKRLIDFQNMVMEGIAMHAESYDRIFVFTFDTIVFAFGRLLFFRSRNLYLFHHDNIDELDNRFKLWFFQRYMNKVSHIVFEEYMREYLVREIGVRPERVFVLPHPLYAAGSGQAAEKTVRENIFAAVSNSNDDALVGEIIEYEKRTQRLSENHCRMVIKSKIHTYESESLKVFHGFLEREEFDALVARARSILLLYPASYHYRMSGMMIEALSGGLSVLGRDIPLLAHYADRYPRSCAIFSSVAQLFDLITASDHTANEEEIARFKTEHSAQAVREAFQKILIAGDSKLAGG